MDIHPSSIIEEGAHISPGCTIGPYCVIGPHVELGPDCHLKSHVYIEGHTSLGKGNRVFPFASIGTAPQDLKFKGESSTLTIGDNNTIREYVTLQPGTKTGTMKTLIGSNNLFMANSHVGHDCRVGNNNVFANSVALAGHVQIGNNVIVGGLCGLHQFIRVGDFVLMGGGSMVAADVAPFTIIQGDRAKFRAVNVIGLQRAGFEKSDITAIRKAYRHIFGNLGGYKEKLGTLPAEIAENPRVKVFTDFIHESLDGSRGLISPAKALSASDE